MEDDVGSTLWEFNQCNDLLFESLNQGLPRGLNGKKSGTFFSKL